MRIKLFNSLICKEAEAHKLGNCKVVIDAQNFFYCLYETSGSIGGSGLRSDFGCESDKYAQFLRSYLIKFKEANVKCYFFFKGGHEESSRMWNKNKKEKSKQFKMGETTFMKPDIKPLLFTKEIHEQVLQEMDFDYVICQYESKRECIAFAQKLECPIISYDIEFCFSGVPYIPAIVDRKRSDIAECKIFKLVNFMSKFNLNNEKLAIFIVLTDEYIFPQNHFQKFMKATHIPVYTHTDRYNHIIRWLSRVSSKTALQLIFKYITPTDQKKFSEKSAQVMEFICRQEKPGLPSQYLENQLNLQFEENDPLWFEKGVVTNAVAIPYVNLYRRNTIPGSWINVDNKAPDALLLSLDIIKYAFSLLSNFGKKEFKFVHENNIQFYKQTMEEILVTVSNIQKPNYTAIESPFENGWSQVRSLCLFEHFLRKTLPNFDFTILENLPEDARLLFITLAYFSLKKPGSINVVWCVLLSYLVLNALSELEGTDPVEINYISYQDKLVARGKLAELLDELPEDEVKAIYDRQRIHTVTEFQHCLQHFNFLNRLCGRPYQSTIFSKTFNGTLVHRTLFSITRPNVDPLNFLENKLNEAPTVLAYWNRLIGVFKK